MGKTNLVIGKKGIGKTRGYMLNEVKNSIREGNNIFIYDIDGEYYNHFMGELLEKGYRVKLLNLDDPKKSNGWNPLGKAYKYYKSGDIDVAIDLISNFGIELFKSDNRNSDPFWENSATNYFVGIVLILFKEANKDEINLGSVLNIINKSNKKTSDYLENYLNKLNVLDPIYNLLSTVEFAPRDTKGSIISVLLNAINLYAMKPNLMNCLSFGEIEVEKEKTVIILRGNSIYNRLANVFINQLIIDIQKNDIGMDLYLDDLQTLPSINQLNGFLESKSELVKLYASSTSLEEMKDLYGKFIDNKFDNIINLSKKLDSVELNTYNKYPEIDQKEIKYFDI